MAFQAVIKPCIPFVEVNHHHLICTSELYLLDVHFPIYGTNNIWFNMTGHVHDKEDQSLLMYDDNNNQLTEVIYTSMTLMQNIDVTKAVNALKEISTASVRQVVCFWRGMPQVSAM